MKIISVVILLSITSIVDAQHFPDLKRKNIAIARTLLKRALADERNDPANLSLRFLLYYKIDSLEGNYKSALKNHIEYKLYYDSAINLEQRQKLNELTLKYAAEKKDEDIKILNQLGIVEQAELEQNKVTRNMMIAGAALLLIIVGLLLNQFRLILRSHAILNAKNFSLENLVGEKTWLLKEVHHRVKNNLLTVTSLLESQAAYLQNDALKAIEKSQHRIYAMSLIHQKLSQTEDMKMVDMSVYLPEFIKYLNYSVGTHQLIKFQLDIEALKFGVSHAIPIALIINEAVTNSIKYAFPGNRDGKIKITMHRADHQINLVIADNGVGMDFSPGKKTSGSLGIKLIMGLTEDIGGAVSFTNVSGTTIVISLNSDAMYISKDSGLGLQ